MEGASETAVIVGSGIGNGSLSFHAWRDIALRGLLDAWIEVFRPSRTVTEVLAGIAASHPPTKFPARSTRA